MIENITLIADNEAANVDSINTRLEKANTNFNSLNSTKADKSTLSPCTLLTSKWLGEKSPFTYKFENAKITATSNQELLPSDTITDKELSALQWANLTDIGQGDGYFMLQANGEKPKIDIPIRIIFRGDM